MAGTTLGETRLELSFLARADVPVLAADAVNEVRAESFDNASRRFSSPSYYSVSALNHYGGIWRVQRGKR